MNLKSHTRWLCENAKSLEKFSGRWVVYDAHQGIVGSGPSLEKILKAHPTATEAEKPFVFHVPSKKELADPVCVVRKK